MNVENSCAITIATLGDWLEISHPSFILQPMRSKTRTLSAYHLNRISRGSFWTNGTALFLSKELNRIEPYNLN